MAITARGREKRITLCYPSLSSRVPSHPAFIRAFEIGGRNAWEDREEVRELREEGGARMKRI